MKKSIFKNDRYKQKRGGYSRLLNISCQKCGPGNLRRMYLDRIIDSTASITKKDLSCSKGHVLGVKIIYEKEKRPAYRLFVDAVSKKIIKS